MNYVANGSCQNRQVYLVNGVLMLEKIKKSPLWTMRWVLALIFVVIVIIAIPFIAMDWRWMVLGLGGIIVAWVWLWWSGLLVTWIAKLHQQRKISRLHKLLLKIIPGLIFVWQWIRGILYHQRVHENLVDKWILPPDAIYMSGMQRLALWLIGVCVVWWVAYAVSRYRDKNVNEDWEGWRFIWWWYLMTVIGLLLVMWLLAMLFN
jgi:hypothetical protein